jgi:peptidoglycan hydrolase-like protein with peptidoglycan-binding domain
VKRWSVVVIALATIVLLAGCGSGKSNNAAPTSSARQTTTAVPKAGTASKPARSKVSTGTAEHRQALGWIRRLQRDLTRLHFYSGPVTGVETPETKTAVMHFQRAAHVKPDGLWGSKSQAALDKLLHRRK